MENNSLATIKVVGIGGGGVNAVNRMVDAGLNGVEFIAINTDQQHLLLSNADVTLDIGTESTKGLGAGADPEVGRQSAEDDADNIKDVLQGADMVFITAGEGGGTGTGGAPVVARIARELGALTVGVVTKPFAFEGRRRMKQALDGIERLKQEVDALIVIPNERLRSLGDKNMSFSEAYRLADESLLKSIQAITEIIVKVGEINVDFADVTSVIRGAGTALIGIGQASGDNRAIKATEQAIHSPLLETSIDGARGVIFCTFGAEGKVGLEEGSNAGTMVEAASHPEVNFISGLYHDETLGDDIRIIVIAAGFDEPEVSTESKPNANGGQISGLNSESSSTSANFSIPATASQSFEDSSDDIPTGIPTGTATATSTTGTTSTAGLTGSTRISGLSNSSSSGLTGSSSIPTVTSSGFSSPGFSSTNLGARNSDPQSSGSLQVLSGQISTVGNAKSSYTSLSTGLPVIEEVEEDNLGLPDFLNE
jgi:cell division protein FtsZ